jgi:hypothetical protein
MKSHTDPHGRKHGDPMTLLLFFRRNGSKPKRELTADDHKSVGGSSVKPYERRMTEE